MRASKAMKDMIDIEDDQHRITNRGSLATLRDVWDINHNGRPMSLSCPREFGAIDKFPTGSDLRRGKRRTDMSESPDSSGNSNSGWRLEHYEAENPVTGRMLKLPIMTNGLCRVTTLKRPGAHHFKYEETWSDVEIIEFEFQALFIGGIASTTYQVLLAHALERCPEYWVGSPRDNDLLYHLMSNIRQALCLLKSGCSEDTRIKRVEFVLSTWSHWKTLSNFKTAEVVL